MLVKRTDGTELVEKTLITHGHDVREGGITSVTLGLFDLGKLIDLSPTEIKIKLVQLHKQFYNPLMERR